MLYVYKLLLTIELKTYNIYSFDLRLLTFGEVHLFNGSSSSISLDNIDASYGLGQELWDQVVGV